MPALWAHACRSQNVRSCPSSGRSEHTAHVLPPAGMCQHSLIEVLINFAGVAGQLNSLGVTGFFADTVGRQLSSANLGWKPVFGLLSVVYYGLHYMFASQTAHVGALYSAFLAMMLSSGAQIGGLLLLVSCCIRLVCSQSRDVLTSQCGSS